MIWTCDAEDRTAHEAERASLLLDDAIVSAGFGERAFKTLKEAAHDLGRLREGVGLEEMIEILREDRLELLGDVDGIAAAGLVARQRAEASYRQRLQRDGETIRLLGVGAGIPNLELADVDADVKAVEPSLDAEGRNERDLDVLVRRRGRLLLTGLPGSGKSTAMRRAAADQAAVPDAPLPLFIDLKKFASRVEGEPALDALVEFVCGGAPPEERDVLREQVLASIGAGNATLYLDALDETRGKKRVVVSAIDDLLRNQDPSLEAVLATRDIGVVEGRTLGFKEARLIPPSNVDQTVAGVLKAVAMYRDIADASTWVKSREQWVKRVLARDPDLRSTPLMPILLAVTATGHSDAAELPSLRAAILKSVVRDVVDQWEAGRAAAGTLHLGALGETRAAEALFGCFVVEGTVLAGESLPSAKAVLAKVSEYLQSNWPLAPGDVEAAARDAVDFWDEAGFFLKTSDGRLEARARLFSELADALHWINADPEALRAWVASNLADPERAEALKLAAGLSRQASEALVREAISAGELPPLRLAVGAIAEGAEASSSLIDELSTALIGVVKRVKDDSVDAAALLVTLPVKPARQRQASKAFAESLPSDQALVAQVRADINWEVPRNEEVLARFKAVLTTRAPQRIGSVRGGQVGVLELWGVDSRWGDAVAGAAEALIPDSEEAARLAATLINETGRGHSERISAALNSAGYDDLVREQLEETTKAMRSTPFRWREIMQRSNEAEVAIFQMIADLGQPRELTVRERRGLDESIDLLYTLGIPDSVAGESDALALDVPEAMRLLIAAVAELGDFDIPRLAAEAQLVLSELAASGPNHVSGLLFIPGNARETKHWDVPKHPKQTRDDLIRIFKTLRFAAFTAAVALDAAPSELEVPKHVRAQRSQLHGWSRRLASLLILSMLSACEAEQAAKQWIDDDDSFGRMAVASFAAQSLETGDAARSLLAKALGHNDAAVRGEAIGSLDSGLLDDQLREQVSAAVKGATCWSCIHCGVENPVDRSACRKCKTNEPDLSRRAEELLSPTA